MPAEELETFNEHIVGEIEVVEAYSEEMQYETYLLSDHLLMPVWLPAGKICSNFGSKSNIGT